MKTLILILVLSVLIFSGCTKDEPVEPTVCYEVIELVYYPVPFVHDTVVPLVVKEENIVDTVCGNTFDELQFTYPGTDSITGTPPDRLLYKTEFIFTIL